MDDKIDVRACIEDFPSRNEAMVYARQGEVVYCEVVRRKEEEL